jgi:hypothetical protein
MNQINQLFSQKLAVANVGLELFAEACKAQRTQCVHVDWRPAANGDAQAADLLARLKKLS